MQLTQLHKVHFYGLLEKFLMGIYLHSYIQGNGQMTDITNNSSYYIEAICYSKVPSIYVQHIVLNFGRQKLGEFGEINVICQYFTQPFTKVPNVSYCKFTNIFLTKTLKGHQFTKPKFCAIHYIVGVLNVVFLIVIRLQFCTFSLNCCEEIFMTKFVISVLLQ